MDDEEIITEERVSLTDHALRRLSVEEFLVDFLGGLIPGVLFFAAAAVVVFPVMHAVLRQEGRTNHPDLEGAALATIAATKDTPNALWFAILIVALLVSYVVGHLFYRHDPNGPDRRSFRWLARRRQYRKTDLAVQPVKKWLWLVFCPWKLDRKEVLREELACENWEECQFPYPHYDEYLKKRGLNHLLPWAVWTSQPDHRTKNYINRLKILLRQRHPDKCASIVRNEAHVRLATSTWYVSGTLLALSVGGLGSLLTLAIVRMRSQPTPLSAVLLGEYLPASSCCFAVLLFALYARISIAQFLHYQRMREVYYVLETALTALHRAPGSAPHAKPHSHGA
jgi:hypothetical protein